jgi:hypothetical protein
MDTETLIRRFIDAYNAHELEAQVGLLFDREVEWAPLRALLEDTVYRGHGGVRQFVRDHDELWSKGHIELLELAVRGEQALTTGRQCLRGRSSGASTEVAGAGSWSARSGRLFRIVYHPTVQDARRELGRED